MSNNAPRSWEEGGWAATPAWFLPVFLVGLALTVVGGGVLAVIGIVLMLGAISSATVLAFRRHEAQREAGGRPRVR